jgi:hypothetical protein
VLVSTQGLEEISSESAGDRTLFVQSIARYHTDRVIVALINLLRNMKINL